MDGGWIFLNGWISNYIINFNTKRIIRCLLIKVGCHKDQCVAFLGNSDIQEFLNILQKIDWEFIKSNLVVWLSHVENLYYLKCLSSIEIGPSWNWGFKIDIRNIILLWLMNGSF